MNTSIIHWYSTVRGVLSLEGNPARIYRAEDAGTKRASREDEPDYNGEGPEYASTCQDTQDVLGWALSTTTYVINRSPSVPLEGDSPQKV